MLNRRHLRIRVLQFVYSWNKSKNVDLAIFEKQFRKSLNKVDELYLYLLLLMIELRDFAINYQEDAKNKKLPTSDDLNPNPKFIENLFLEKLKEDSSLLSRINSYKLSFADHQPLIKSIFFKIKESEVFKEYMTSSSTNFQEDKKFVVQLFSKLLIEMESLQDFLCEKNMFWDDDLPFISSMIVKTIKDSTPSKLALLPLFKNQDDQQFSINLLRHTIVNFDEFSELIDEKTQNWEIERVAQIDLILMQMALAELLKMPHIPVKVSINEYLELAKYYSTSNSKSFVNGILDNILSDLKEKRLIKKIGRGLIE